MRFLRALKAKFLAANPISGAVALYLFAILSDYASTLFAQRIPGVFETNVFMRNENLQLVLHKAIVVDGLLLGLIIVACFSLKGIFDLLRPRLGEVVVSLVFLALAVHRIWDAVIPNVLIGLNFFVGDSHL
jgi:hypothetical protein